MKRFMIFIIMAGCLTFQEASADEKESGKGAQPLKRFIGQEVIESLIRPMEEIIQPVFELERIVVTPTKTEEKLGAASSSITYIGKDTLEKEHIYTVKEALRNTVGVDVAENGRFAGTTSVFLRGANSNQTLVLMDGVKLYDPIAPGAAFNFNHLTTDNIDRIEVVRGSQSALYGSDAVGGVINIETKKAERPFVNAAFEAGSFYTTHESVECGAKTKGLHYSFGFSRFDTKGVPCAQVKNNNPERDDYERTGLSGRIDYDITEGLTIGGTTRYTTAKFEYDEFGFDDPDLTARHEDWLFTNYIDHKVFDWWRYIVRCGWMNTLRKDFDENNFSTPDYMRDKYSGKYFKVDYQNNFIIKEIDTIVIGYDYTEEMGDSYREQNGVVSDMPKVFARNSSLYLENRLNLNDRLTSTQGMRIDYHSQAGTHITYKIDGSYLFPWATKMRGSVATGFKAPTLYQLNAPVIPSWFGWGGFDGGNPSLQPETSQSYEFGLDQFIFSDKGILSWTYFHTRFKDLINARVNPVTWHVDQYTNINKAYSHGNEFEIKLKPIDTFETSFSYTLMETRDYGTDSSLLKRPDRKFKFEADWTVFPKFETDLIIKYVGPRMDWGLDKLKEYYRVDVIMNYQLTKNMTVFARVENLFDERYEETRGYTEPGISAYGGVKAAF